MSVQMEQESSFSRSMRPEAGGCVVEVVGVDIWRPWCRKTGRMAGVRLVLSGWKMDGGGSARCLQRLGRRRFRSELGVEAW